MNKVVVTGMGAVSSIGCGTDKFWNNLIDGKCGIKTFTRVDPDKFDTKVGAEADGEFEELIKKYFTKRQLNSTTVSTRMALASAGEAVDDSGIDFTAVEGTRAAVIYGVTTTTYVSEKEKERNFILKDMPSNVPSLLSAKYGINGPSFNLSCACSSAGYAVSMAANLIETGMFDVVIAGGMSGCISDPIVRGFSQILALSVNPDPETACRPFTKNRDGFIMGEGAGTLILESEEHAKKRNAKIYARLAGYGMYSEASDMTCPLEDGAGMKIVMERALEKAGLGINDIDYINAHGTSTNLNDKYETRAIKDLFGEKAYSIPVSSIKSSIGHTLAGGSALEAIASIKAINTGIIPATIHFDEPDPDLDLDYVPNKAREHEVKRALSNSFGFGGQNVSLIFEKY